jgi:hypothetical protein
MILFSLGFHAFQFEISMVGIFQGGPETNGTRSSIAPAGHLST